MRRFKIPTLNFSAAEYNDLISIFEFKVTAPPLLKHISNEDVRDMIDSGNYNNIEVLNCPCHTKSVERTLKLVTEASAALCGTESRDGFMRSRFQSRNIMPFCNTKSDYQS
uniref:Uncharacterized protein LOC114345263 isoform X2 n=1 Tax=Diabrotica virgifera virgifera TaxID=50390 RepID=A0A6P7GPQ1_DIAVI